MMYQPPILITGVPRSGASIIAGAFHMSGAYGGADLNKMYENPAVKVFMEGLMKRMRADALGFFPMPLETRLQPIKGIEDELWKAAGSPTGSWYVKDSRLLITYPIWVAAFPDAKWVIVKRDLEDVIQSCMKTHYMDRFSKEEGWRWMAEQYQARYEQLSMAAKNIAVLRPVELLSNPDELKKTIEWSGLRWSDEVVEFIEYKLRKKRNETNSCGIEKNT